MSETRNRSRNLLDKDIASIVSILDGWSEKKLTWDSLIDNVEFRMKQRYTRQTLAKHPRIKRVYELTKERLSNQDHIDIKEPKGYDALVQKIHRLEAENTRLTKENNSFLAQFARWAYNAYIKGITQDELDNPLHRVNRRQDV